MMDPLALAIEGNEFSDTLCLEGIVTISIRELPLEDGYETEHPLLLLTVSLPVSRERLISRYLLGNPRILDLQSRVPERDGRLTWSAKVKFEAACWSCDQDWNSRRKQSIRFAWNRIVTEIKAAILGDGGAPPVPEGKLIEFTR